MEHQGKVVRYPEAVSASSSTKIEAKNLVLSAPVDFAPLVALEFDDG